MAEPNIDFRAAWLRLKSWAAKRHDYFESQYKETNFSADAAELGAYRAVYQAMRDIEEAIQIEAIKAAKQQGVSRPSPTGRGSIVGGAKK